MHVHPAKGPRVVSGVQSLTAVPSGLNQPVLQTFMATAQHSLFIFLKPFKVQSALTMLYWPPPSVLGSFQ